ncbi:TetR/AcrR family transcriptional regulator [Amycolatopsis pithecellobii]|uniref:TetR family transcriptional regulator n=1 Tax=Amycolatopsis pithecellobii TaxID=664692 RepID=A0A6N7Z0V4_9PSEU|nr:TetR/AcrR family transcriptional regulator [Amycolatopsis pithecellobii]MTD53240.1 TetR family transcriptional regulator [Amycolatopsis pithecellobii]
MTTGEARRPRGRPRDTTLESRVLEAATELLLEGGVAACTVEAVSKRSGVSKPTIYRRWPQRTALAIDAFAAHIAHQVPLAETADTAADLLGSVTALAGQYQGRDGRVFVELIAAAVLEPGTADLLNERFFAPRREALRALWKRGVDLGQLDPHVDADLMIDLLFGPTTFRMLLGRQIDAETALELARAALRGFTTHPTHDQ